MPFDSTKTSSLQIASRLTIESLKKKKKAIAIVMNSGLFCKGTTMLINDVCRFDYSVWLAMGGGWCWFYCAKYN